MATSLAQEGRQLARKVLFYQSLIAIVLALFFALYSGEYSGISAFYGGLVCILPGAVFALLAFRYAGASQIKLVVRSFNKGSKFKFILTIIMFGCAFKWLTLQPLPLISTYVVTLMAQWPIIIFLNRVRS